MVAARTLAFLQFKFICFFFVITALAEFFIDYLYLCQCIFFLVIFLISLAIAFALFSNEITL
jgi:hypothetical protein